MLIHRNIAAKNTICVFCGYFLQNKKRHAMSFKKHLFLKCVSYQLCIIKKMKEIETDIVIHDIKIDILNISVDIVIHRG